ncbi:MAG: sucrose-phosphate synthase [uncultured bacterium]|nr:MAG: sucrose-phosphate synthase [uncultured bacterium]HBH17702.1 hypothetical protein [Cyanobacteria bacterium UBA9579]
MKKKVFFISQNTDVSGSQLNLKNIISFLKDDYDIFLWSPTDGELAKYYRENNIPLYVKDFFVDSTNRFKEEIEFSQETEKQIKRFIKKYRSSNKKIAIRCAGRITEKLLEEYDFSEVNLIGLFDGNPALFGKEIGGVPVYSKDEIDKFDIDILVIAHKQPKHLREEFKGKKIKIIDDLFIGSRTSRVLRLLRFYTDLIEPIKLIAKINPDIVFINNLRCFWVVIAGKLLGKKVIWAIHECFSPRTFQAFPQNVFLSSFRFVDRFIFPSRITAEMFKEFVPENKVNIIGNGLNISDIEKYKQNISIVDVKNELGIPLDHKIICNVGITDSVKGQIHLVKAGINLLKKSPDKNFSFILVGAKENLYLANIRSMINEAGFMNHFHLIPVTRDPFKYLSISDIYVCSSMQESFGIALIEAMAFNIPIIATDTYAIPELISHNETGMLIPLKNMEIHIENEINNLVNNPEKMKILAENAHRKLLSQYTIEIEVAKYKKVIEG